MMNAWTCWLIMESRWLMRGCAYGTSASSFHSSFRISSVSSSMRENSSIDDDDDSDDEK